MKPVVKALNILKSETDTHTGWLLSVMFQLQAKLSRLETSSKMCLPLIRAVQDGVQKRFEMMHDPELIAAAILLPKFKNTWTERAEIIEAGLVYVKQNLDQMAEAAVEQIMSLSSDEDFFSSMKSRRSQGLPASAACERLFSSAGLLFTAKRARISSDLENQLLLKLNKFE
uniref:uncharacterized protein LOC109974981 isoform X2 n=1 Tax=Monopterus albus TaxID=43700 RepID=UPI0009B4C6B6|nr:uncharacterized protein LOC109974981 isoform X2 [Monopterus albus]